ncbi:MAG: hypothetical protein JXP34_11570 [Planctomycetes bacterium]|nr:hypothetical protein [Planctomycetota bacterium]
MKKPVSWLVSLLVLAAGAVTGPEPVNGLGCGDLSLTLATPITDCTACADKVRAYIANSAGQSQLACVVVLSTSYYNCDPDSMDVDPACQYVGACSEAGYWVQSGCRDDWDTWAWYSVDIGSPCTPPSGEEEIAVFTSTGCEGCPEC